MTTFNSLVYLPVIDDGQPETWLRFDYQRRTFYARPTAEKWVYGQIIVHDTRVVHILGCKQTS